MQKESFIRDYVEQTKEFVTTIPRKLKHLKEIEAKITNEGSDAFNLIQKIIGGNTSDLIKCEDVIISSSEENDWRSNNATRTVNRILTFNHKGLGTIRKASNGSTPYGGNQSETMHINDMTAYFGDKELVDKTIVSLATQNRRKMLMLVKQLTTASPYLISISGVMKINDKRPSYTCSDVSVDGVDHIKILFPVIDTTTGVINLTPKEIKKIIFESYDTMNVLSEEVPDGEEDNSYKYRNSGHRFTMDNNQDVLAMMQFTDELNKILDQKIIDYTANYDILKNDVLEIKNSLAAHIMVMELNKGNE
jgi:hypothetical protein